jgi:hypothetical protein
VASLPGLNGTGFSMVNAVVCEEELDGRGPAFAAKVNIMFRPRTSAPALVFATITFLGSVLPDQLASDHETVEAQNCSIDASGQIHISPQWSLFLQKTTVLLRSP